MKNVILFVIILTVCGSLKMADKKPCPEMEVKRSMYLKGKLVHTTVWRNGFFVTKTNLKNTIEGGKTVYADSVTYTLK